jgi:hypothetical protein
LRSESLQDVRDCPSGASWVCGHAILIGGVTVAS